MNYKKIIFDLDNTVLDFRDAEENALRKIIESYDLSYTSETVNTYKEINHGLWRDLEEGVISREHLFSSRFALFLEAFGHRVEGKRVDDLYREHLGDGVKKIAHAQETLTALKENGYHLYAGTNGVAQTQWKRLTGSRLVHYFEDVFISEEIGVEKPDPQFFEHIFKALNTSDRDQFLMVGDSLTSDIQGANNAGIDSVWFNPHGLEKPAHSENVESTYTISSLLELLSLFSIEKEESYLNARQPD